MTVPSIVDAWSVRADTELHFMADAAKCRSESDWLVGLNSTRALTCFRSRHGGFNITAAGRVRPHARNFSRTRACNRCLRVAFLRGRSRFFHQSSLLWQMV